MMPDLDTLTMRLRKGGWSCILHGDGRDETLWVYRSQLDPRVTVIKTVPRRRAGEPAFAFSFQRDLPGDDMEAAINAVERREDEPSSPTLHELVAALVAHDQAQGLPRPWQVEAGDDDLPLSSGARP